jgi:hypothetical protein
MKIKNKTELKEILLTENYDKIVLFNNGTWTKITTGTDVSNDKEVCLVLNRVFFYDVTRKEVQEKIKEMEFSLNYDIEY